MSIQYNLDLALVGNITIDEVYHINKWPSEGTSNSFHERFVSVGGLGNIVRALKGKGLKIGLSAFVGEDEDGRTIADFLSKEKVEHRLSLSKNPTTRAIILSDVAKGERTSFVNWGCGLTATPLPERAEWTHIAYLDIISKSILEEIRKKSKFVSADLCLSSPSKEIVDSVSSNLRLLDYLFLSESEVLSYSPSNSLTAFCRKHGLRQVVYHTRQNTILAGVEEATVDCRHEILEGLDVLGAGDAYCANFIFSRLAQNNNITACGCAHLGAADFLGRWRR